VLSDINGVRVGIVQAVTFSRRLKAAGLRPASVNATLRSLFLRLFRLVPDKNQLKSPRSILDFRLQTLTDTENTTNAN
jgi:hypothetical protein